MTELDGYYYLQTGKIKFGNGGYIEVILGTQYLGFRIFKRPNTNVTDLSLGFIEFTFKRKRYF